MTILTRTLRGQLAWQPEFSVTDWERSPLPYRDLAGNEVECQAALRDDIIIITGRFRSGSTLLWNLFRQIDGITAYYEPFNERRWFDPRSRGDRVDPTHRNVADYWREYQGLEDLCEHYSEEWTRRDLYMGGSFWAPQMKRYVDCLIDRAPGRPLLQFNRVDLRLPWFRRNFRNAKILHIYRHPRDQWCSSLQDPSCFPKTGRMHEFAPHDKYYLRAWAADLKHHFPFLEEEGVSHPYPLFYFIWRLSYAFGRRFADYSLRFEDLVADANHHVPELMEVAGVRSYDLRKLVLLIDQPVVASWHAYADEEWFRKHEANCERILAEFFASLESRAVPEETAGANAGGLGRRLQPKSDRGLAGELHASLAMGRKTQ